MSAIRSVPPEVSPNSSPSGAVVHPERSSRLPAAMTLGLLRGQPLASIHENANQIASYVCSCAGATPMIPASLRDFSFSPVPAIS